MKSKLLFLILLSFFIPIFGQNAFFPVRVAGYFGTITLPVSASSTVILDLPAFCQRAKNAGYNYIYLWFPASIAPSDAQMLFQTVDNCGMRTIPQVSLASSHDFQCGWGDYTKFPLSNVNYIGIITWNGVSYPMGSTSFADETILRINGIDYWFVKFLQNIKSGFQSANLHNCAIDKNGNKYLEYIHLGHDESYFQNSSNPFNLLAGFGGSSPDAHGRQYSQTDRTFITNYLNQSGKSTAYSEAFRALFANEIARRVKQVQSSANFYPLAKVMIYSDMWDPNLYAGINFGTYLNQPVTLAPNKTGHTNEIIDLPGLSSSDKTLVESNVVHMPWCFDMSWINNAGVTYSFLTTTAYFLSGHMKYLSLCCDINADNSGGPIDSRGQQSVDAAVSVSRLYPANYIGYMTAPWFDTWDNTKTMDNQSLGFETEEYLQKMERPSYTSTIMRSLY